MYQLLFSPQAKKDAKKSHEMNAFFKELQSKMVKWGLVTNINFILGFTVLNMSKSLTIVIYIGKKHVQH